MTPTQQKIGAAVGAVVLAAAAFVVGGHTSASDNTLHMAGGSTGLVKCNGAQLHSTLNSGKTIAQMTCDPSPGSSTTSSSSTTTPVIPTTTGTTIPPPTTCGLNAAAAVCWAANTGVPGFTEAAIVAGQSTLVHHVGDITMTTPGQVLANTWVDGCIAIKAPGVIIKDDLVRSQDRCKGGDGGTAGSLIDSGGAVMNARAEITDTTVDGENLQADRPCIGTVSMDLVRVNAFACTKVLWPGAETTATDSYFHDDNPVGTTHLDVVFPDGSTNVIINHDYVVAAPGDFQTSAMGILCDYGGGFHITVENSYLDGKGGADAYGGQCTNRANEPANRGEFIQFLNDAFNPDAKAPMLYFDPAIEGNAWTNNYNSETLAQLPPSGLQPYK